VSKIELEIFGSMVTFIQGTHRKADESLSDSGISSSQFYMLRHIGINQPVIQLRLASSLGVTPGAISQQLVKLEEMGLLLREPVGKKKLLRLTADGQALVDRLESGYAPFMASVFSPLTKQEKSDLYKILRKLALDSS